MARYARKPKENYVSVRELTFRNGEAAKLDADIKSFYNDYNFLVENDTNRNKGGFDIYRPDSSEWYNSVSGIDSSLQAKADDILKRVGYYKDFLGDDYYNNITKDIANIKSNSGIIKSNAQNSKDFYTQFAGEESYNQWLENYKYINQDANVLKKELEDIKAQLDSLTGGNPNNFTPEAHALAKQYEEKTVYYNQLLQDQEVYEILSNKDKYNDLYEQAQGFKNPMFYSIKKGAEGKVNRAKLGETAIGADPANKHGAEINEMRQMTDDERYVYSVLFAQDPTRAEEYYQSLVPTLQDRINKDIEESVARVSKIPVLRSAMSIPFAAGAGLENAINVGKYLTGATDELERSEFSDASAALREGATGWMGDDWLGKTGKFVYNTAMSGIDSVVSTALLGPTGAGVSLGLSAAASATNDALDRGMGSGRAVLNGIFAGAFEGIFESFSLSQLDALKGAPVDSFKTYVKEIAKQMGVNATEEMATEAANIIYDSVVNGQYSNYAKMRADGMSPGEAILSLGKDIGLAGASGALMGFGFGSVGGAIGAGKYKNQTAQIKSELEAAGYGENADLVASAMYKQEYAKKVPDAQSFRPTEAEAEALRNYEGKVKTDRARYELNGYLDALKVGKYGKENAAQIEIGDRDTARVAEAFALRYQQGARGNEIGGFNSPKYSILSENEQKIAYNAGKMDAIYQKEQKAKSEGAKIAQDAAKGEGLKTDNATSKESSTTVFSTSSNVSSEIAKIDNAKMREYAKSFKLGVEGVKSYGSLKNDEQGVGQYTEDFVRAYNAGKNGADISRVPHGSLTDAQRQIAYNSGKMDAIQATVDDKKSRTKTFANGSKVVVADQTKLTAEQKNITDAFAKAGIKVYLADIRTKNGDSANGLYDHSTGIIYLSTDPKKALQFIAKHELTHFVEKRIGQQQYFDLMNTIFDSETFKKWYEGKGFKSLTEMTSNKIAEYRQGGTKLDDMGAKQEILADFVGEMLFGGEKQISDNLFSELDNNHKKTFREWISALIDRLKKLFSGNKTAENEITKLEAKFKDMLRESVKSEVKGKGGVSLYFGNDTNANSNANGKFSQQFIDETVNSFGINIKKLSDYVYVQNKVFETLNNENFFEDKESSTRTDVNIEKGMIIETNKKGIKETFDFDNYSRLGKNKKIAKLATIRLIPEVIKYGHVVADNVPNKYNNRDTNKQYAYIEHRATVEGIDSIIKIAIKKTPQKNKFWVHSVYVIKNANDLLASTKYGTVSNYLTVGSKDNISQKAGTVNPSDEKTSKNSGASLSYTYDSDGEQLTNGQSEYFKDSKMRDDNGNLKVMYHGSPNAGFYIFDPSMSDDGISLFFTDNKDVASSYSGMSETSANYKVYLNLTNPLIVDARGKEWDELPSLDNDSPYEYIKIVSSRYNVFTEEQTIVLEYLERGESKPITEEFDPDNFDMDISEAIQMAAFYGDEYVENLGGDKWKTRDYAEYAKAADYDGVIFKNIYDSGNHSIGSEHESTVAIAFNSEQIKSVANENPTADKDIRFSYTPDDEQELTRMARNGEISAEEYGRRMLEIKDSRRTEDPYAIARMNKEDLENPLPNLNRKDGEAKGDGQSKFYDSLQRSKLFDETFKKEVESDKFIEQYKTITNKETLAEAAKLLDEGGEDFVNTWFNKSTVRMSTVDTMVGFILLKRYQDIGNYNSAVAVAEKLREVGTRTGQKLQAFSILSRFTPEMMQVYAQKQLDAAFEEMVKSKTQNWINKNKDKFKLTDEDIDFIRTRTLQAAMLPNGSREQAIRLAEITARLQDKIPPTFSTSFKTWSRMSMLFNAKTHIRNVLGNGIIAPAFVASDWFGTPVDLLLSKFTGQRTTGLTGAMRHNKKDLADALKGAHEAYEDFLRGINTRIDFDKFKIDGAGKGFNEQKYGKMARVLNNIDSFNSFLLTAEDALFYEMWFMNSLNNQKKLNNVSEATLEMIEIAQQEALQRTWQDNNIATKVVGSIKKVLNLDFTFTNQATGKTYNPYHNRKILKILPAGYGFGDVFIKFVKTPANLTKAIYDFSPAAFISVAGKSAEFISEVKKGTVSPKLQKDLVNSVGKAIAGSLVYAIFGALYAAGKITGKGDDDKDIATFEKYVQGMPEYAIKIGKKWWSYDWAQPVGAIPAIIANAQESIADNDKGSRVIWEALSAGGDVLFDQSFMSSIQQIFSSTNFFGNLATAVLNEITVPIPTLSSQIANVFDDKRRTTYNSQSSIRTAINKVAQKIPGLRNTLEVERDILGRETPNSQKHWFNAFFNPATTYTDTSTAVTDHVYELYQSTGKASAIPAKAPYDVTIKGVKHTFSIEERNEYQHIMGETSAQIIGELINNDSYMALTDEQKLEVIKSVYSYAQSLAKSEMGLAESYDVISGIRDITEDEYNALSDEGIKAIADDYVLSSYYSISDFDSSKKATWFVNKSLPTAVNAAIKSGDMAKAQKLIKSVEANVKSLGLPTKEAKEMIKKSQASIKSEITSYWKEKFIEAHKRGDNGEKIRIKQMLVDTGLYGNSADVRDLTNGWKKEK